MIDHGSIELELIDNNNSIEDETVCLADRAYIHPFLYNTHTIMYNL